MRELTAGELGFVAGGCPEDSGNDYGGVKDPGTVGDDLIKIYEGVVAFTSHVIERVANAL
jgi:hypothetical protein